MRTFRIGVVGCGGVSGMHFRGLQGHPKRVTVAAACDPDGEALAKAKAPFGFERGFASIQEMIDGADWEVAVVCTPTPVRSEVVGLLASAGKHVFVEKPMADSLAEAKDMVAQCAGEEVKLAVNQNFRYHYPFDIARKIIAEGLLGKVLTIAVTDLMWRQDSGWRTGCKRHALSVMGVHWLDGLRWMLDDEAASISCRMHSSPAIDCAGETDAAATIAMESGAVASYVQSFSSPVGRNETLVIGERGLLVLRYASAELFVKGQKEPVQHWENIYAAPAKPESAFKGLDELLTAIVEDAAPANSGRDNLKTIALLEGAYRSAETGRAVELAGGLPI